MSKNERLGRVVKSKVKIEIEWDEVSGDIQFSFGTPDPMRLLGMLELAREAVLQRYRHANAPTVVRPPMALPTKKI